jgi:hypothetical protein
MKSKIEAGAIVEVHNAALLSDADFEALTAKHAEVGTEEFWEATTFETNDAIAAKLAENGIVLEELEDNGDVYIDAVTNLNDMTVTVHGIYEATFGTYGIIVHSEIATNCLPLTIALPSTTAALLSQYK